MDSVIIETHFLSFQKSYIFCNFLFFFNMQIGNKSRLRKDEWNTLAITKKKITNKIRLNVNKFVSTMTSKISFEIFNILRENYNVNSVCFLSQCINLIKIGSFPLSTMLSCVEYMLKFCYIKTYVDKTKIDGNKTLHAHALQYL